MISQMFPSLIPPSASSYLLYSIQCAPWGSNCLNILLSNYVMELVVDFDTKRITVLPLGFIYNVRTFFFLKTGLSSCLSFHTCLNYRPALPPLANSICHVSGECFITDFITRNMDFSPSSGLSIVEPPTLKHVFAILCISTIPKIFCHEY